MQTGPLESDDLVDDLVLEALVDFGVDLLSGATDLVPDIRLLLVSTNCAMGSSNKFPDSQVV